MVNTVLIQTPENGEQCVKTNNGNEKHDNNSFMSVEVPNKLHYIQLTLYRPKSLSYNFLDIKLIPTRNRKVIMFLPSLCQISFYMPGKCRRIYILLGQHKQNTRFGKFSQDCPL